MFARGVSLLRGLVSSGSFVFAWIQIGALGVVRFILMYVDSLRRSIVSSVSIVLACVDTAGLVAFIRVRVGSLQRNQGSSRSFKIAWVHSGARRGSLVHPGPREFTLVRREVVGIILIFVRKFGRA